MKLLFWGNQISKGNTVHFPCFTDSANIKKCTELITVLKVEFQSWFADLLLMNYRLKLFESPFSTDANSAPSSMQMELIVLQCNSELERKFREVPLIQSYINLHFSGS